ncbi:MAG: bifunctional nuclease family protein [Desulfovibrionaceae bacterium]|nr:bifunctional nuclease family protein [Desulfovibrionaceae bacterium]
MVIMQVIGLTVDSATKTPIVVLQESSGRELLPIWIGAMEAMAISLALSGGTLPRPLTHDLLLQTLEVMEGRLEAVDITGLCEGTYYAELLLARGDTVFRVDCRPSDGIALALRVPAPIRVSEHVLQEAAKARLRPSEEGTAQLTRPTDTTTDMVRQAADRLEAEAHRDGTPRSVSTLSFHGGAADGPEEDRRLADLLKKLEPESSRKM